MDFISSGEMTYTHSGENEMMCSRWLKRSCKSALSRTFTSREEESRIKGAGPGEAFLLLSPEPLYRYKNGGGGMCNTFNNKLKK